MPHAKLEIPIAKQEHSLERKLKGTDPYSHV